MNADNLHPAVAGRLAADVPGTGHVPVTVSLKAITLGDVILVGRPGRT
jgi:hypothetical protein